MRPVDDKCLIERSSCSTKCLGQFVTLSAAFVLCQKTFGDKNLKAVKCSCMEMFKSYQSAVEHFHVRFKSNPVLSSI